MKYQTIALDFRESTAMITFQRAEQKNTITPQMVEELQDAVRACEKCVKAVVFQGNEEYFCFGADFQADTSGDAAERGLLYDLWMYLTTAPFVSICYVKGRVNAGGIGFLAASDIVIADDKAEFSLSEMLFGLYPAMVLPFLIRRIGFQHTNYMTLMTKPFSAQEALAWGLADVVSPQSRLTLGKHLARLSQLPYSAIAQYKQYAAKCSPIEPNKLRDAAVSENQKIFSSADVLQRIERFSKEGILSMAD